jgi:hypothetical protein
MLVGSITTIGNIRCSTQRFTIFGCFAAGRVEKAISNWSMSNELRHLGNACWCRWSRGIEFHQ